MTSRKKPATGDQKQAEVVDLTQFKNELVKELKAQFDAELQKQQAVIDALQAEITSNETAGAPSSLEGIDDDQAERIARVRLAEQTSSGGKYEYRVIHLSTAYGGSVSGSEKERKRQWAVNAFGKPFRCDEPDRKLATRFYKDVTRLRTRGDRDVYLVPIHKK